MDIREKHFQATKQVAHKKCPSLEVFKMQLEKALVSLG